jgi:hypothetical protein
MLLITRHCESEFTLDRFFSSSVPGTERMIVSDTGQSSDMVLRIELHALVGRDELDKLRRASKRSTVRRHRYTGRVDPCSITA